MIIHDKMVEVIRNALVDYESATGLECQIRYADRLSAVVEVVLELAEDSNVGQARCVTVPVPEPVNLDEDVEEMDEDEPDNSDKYRQVMEMREKGIRVADIAKAMNCSVNTVYNYLKYAREMENK